MCIVQYIRGPLTLRECSISEFNTHLQERIFHPKSFFKDVVSHSDELVELGLDQRLNDHLLQLLQLDSGS